MKLSKKARKKLEKEFRELEQRICANEHILEKMGERFDVFGYTPTDDERKAFENYLEFYGKDVSAKRGMKTVLHHIGYDVKIRRSWSSYGEEVSSVKIVEL